MQKTPDFSLESAGKRISPIMAGFIYHGERIKGDRLLLASRHIDTRGWASVSDVVPIAEAEAFFSREILRHPSEPFLFLIRGLVCLKRTTWTPLWLT